MDPSSLLYMAMAVFGIGLVIFVHELGHYLAARLCGVRVETFSLGMGPRLVGWRVGPTLYQIALVPLGGFCRMAGEERRRDGRAPLPDELPAKSVGARFFIYSGGVLMNVLFGLTVFPILFHFGVRFSQPVLGEPYPGSPAWHARLAAGLEVLEVNGSRVIDFSDIHGEVAIGNPDATVLLLRDPRTGETRERRITPRYEPEIGVAMIGVRPALDLDGEGRPALLVDPEGPAAEAGLQDGDRLVAVEGSLPGLPLARQLDERVQSGEPFRVRVARAGGAGAEGAPAELEVALAARPAEEPGPARLGIHPPYNAILDVRSGPETDRIDLRPDDRVLAAGGRPILRAHDFRRALTELGTPLDLLVRRGARELTVALPALTPAETLSLLDDLQVDLDRETCAVVVQPGEAGAAAGLQDTDCILAVDGVRVEDFTGISNLVRKSVASGRPTHLALERPGPDGQSRFLDLDVTPAAAPRLTYGLGLREAVYTFRTGSVFEAMRIGTQRSWKSLIDSWLVLERILQGRISAEQSVGGIITIGVLSYSSAEAGLDILFYLLCIISINLAFLNVLPIPVLDGGHLLFLLVEKIKGSPVSERVLGYSQMVGVVLILSLVVYVTYNDLMRWVFPS